MHAWISMCDTVKLPVRRGVMQIMEYLYMRGVEDNV